VDAGLPMYLALERKPDNGGEIQNLAVVASGIMLHLKVVTSANEEKAGQQEDKLPRILLQARRRSHRQQRGDSLDVSNSGTRSGGGRGRCRCINAYNQEDPSAQAQQRGTSCSGKVQHQGLHEALYLCLQRVHACNQCHAEAVLVLQPHDGGGERLLRQAHRLAP